MRVAEGPPFLTRPASFLSHPTLGRVGGTVEIPPTPALLSGPHSWGVILRGRRGAGKGPKAGTLPPFSPLLLKTSSQSTGDLPRPLPRGQKHPGLR